jgi:hypothetical protein
MYENLLRQAQLRERRSVVPKADPIAGHYGQQLLKSGGESRLHRLRRAEARCDPDGAVCPITGSREGLRAAGFCAL